MSTRPNDPAFPIPGVFPQTGMSLRAYFAGQALNGILSEYKTSEYAPHQIAREAIVVADALIAELNKTQQ